MNTSIKAGRCHSLALHYGDKIAHTVLRLLHSEAGFRAKFRRVSACRGPSEFGQGKAGPLDTPRRTKSLLRHPLQGCARAQQRKRFTLWRRRVVRSMGRETWQWGRASMGREGKDKRGKSVEGPRVVMCSASKPGRESPTTRLGEDPKVVLPLLGTAETGYPTTTMDEGAGGGVLLAENRERASLPTRVRPEARGWCLRWGTPRGVL